MRQYPTGFIAKGIGVTKGEVKRWKAGTRQPSAPNLLELACLIPTVNALVMERIGRGEHPESAQAIDAAVRAAMRAKP